MSAESWFSLAALAVIVCWVIAMFVGLRQRRRRIANAFRQMDIHLRARHELMPQVLEAARRSLGPSAATIDALRRSHRAALLAVEDVRSQPMDAPAVGALALAEQDVDASLARLRAIAENHGQLSSDAAMHSLFQELGAVERRIDWARQMYNEEVVAYNDEAEEFPGLLVARIFRFLPAAPLHSASGARDEAPRVAF